MSTIFFKPCDKAKDRLSILVPLSHDVELTIFGDDGRDITLKAKQGDSLAFDQIDGDWVLQGTMAPYEIEDFYVEIGGE